RCQRGLQRSHLVGHVFARIAFCAVDGFLRCLERCLRRALVATATGREQSSGENHDDKTIDVSMHGFSFPSQKSMLHGMRSFWPMLIRFGSLRTSRLASKIFGYRLPSP